jgi:hypothetical protein
MLNDYQRNCRKDLTVLLDKTQVIFNPSEINRYGNKFNIDFEFSSDVNNEMDIVFFSSLINKELQLRGLPGVGNLAESQSRLRVHLLIEQRLERIKEAIEQTREGKETALILIKQAVPCIMHTENWVGEKIVTVLSAIGTADYQSDRGSDNLDLYAQQVEEVVQTRILGMIHRPKMWRFSLKENRKEIAKVALSNKKTQQFINNIDVLIDVVFHKPEHAGRRDIWRDMMEQYRLAMQISASTQTMK